jgi:hypothetical protein
MMNNRPAGYYQMLDSRAFHGHNKGMGDVADLSQDQSLAQTAMGTPGFAITSVDTNVGSYSLLGNSSQYAGNSDTIGAGMSLWLEDPSSALSMLPSALGMLTDPTAFGLVIVPVGIIAGLLLLMKNRR